MPAVWNEQANSIFLQALELPLAERESFVLQACGDDAALSEQVRSLLAASARAAGFLESPPTAVANLADTAREQAVEPPSLAFLLPSDRPGSLGRLGNYEITRVIGRGGMGIVLEGRDMHLDRVVAVKVLAPQLAVTAAARHRFLREAKAAAAVRDEHVVTIYAVEDAGGKPYLVMELIAGLSLQERISKEGPLQLREILRIGAQAARGLAAAHANGLIHRDIKPANILLENHIERVKLTDFGLARVAAEASLTQSGVITGTPQYMSPEQAQDQPLDVRSDLFSLGSVLYAMCTGHGPFRAESTVAALRRVCDDTPRPIHNINPDLPDWLAAIINRLLAKNPADRVQSAAEVADLLGRHLADLQQPNLQLPRDESLTKSKARNPKSKIGGRWMLVAGVLLGSGAALGLSEATGWTHLLNSLVRIDDREGAPITKADNAKGQREPAEAPGSRESAPAGTNSAHTIPTPEMKEIRRFDGHEAIVWSVAFSPDGSRALSGSGGQVRKGRLTLGSDFAVRLWDVASARQLHSFAGHDHQVLSVAFTPDGRHALGAGKIWACRRWDVETVEELPGFPGDRGRPFYHLALSADASRLLSWGGKDKVLRLWDVTTGTELWKFAGLEEEVSAAAFSADGRHVATAGGGKYEQHELRLSRGSDYSIRLWNAVSGKEEFRLRGHYAFVRGLAFLPDGRRLLSAGADNVLRLWDLQTREELHIYQGHTRPVNAIVLSQDGRWALSGSADMTVRLWDVETRKELCRYMGHTAEVRSVAFSPDDRYALSGGDDEAVRLWQLPEPEK